jgi:hypothetical protein
MRISKRLAKRAGTGQLKHLSNMRKQFDRSLGIDAQSRLKIMTIAQKQQAYVQQRASERASATWFGGGVMF